MAIKMPAALLQAFFCYGDEENARIYAMHLTTANQSEIRKAYLALLDRSVL